MRRTSAISPVPFQGYGHLTPTHHSAIRATKSVLKLLGCGRSIAPILGGSSLRGLLERRHRDYKGAELSHHYAATRATLKSYAERVEAATIGIAPDLGISRSRGLA